LVAPSKLLTAAVSLLSKEYAAPESCEKWPFLRVFYPNPTRRGEQRQPGFTKLHLRLSNSCLRRGHAHNVSLAKSAFRGGNGFSGCMGLRIASMN
jgi:hypothetical protein